MYGSSFQVFAHFTHAHFIFLHNAVTTLFIMVLGGAGAYNTIFKIELLVKIILSKNLNKNNVRESFFLLSFNFISFVFRLLPYKKRISIYILFYFI